jgi:rSAM/selenodomain-associated transferase 1
MATTADCIVAVFAKAPYAGEVKTRLIPLLGAAGAAALHCRLLEHTLATAHAASLGPIELWCAPDASDAVLQEYAARTGASLLDQGAGTLGDRMERAFQSMLARAPCCMLIGSDCPALTSTDLNQAASALVRSDCDAVFGPAEDGGYVLVGLKHSHPALFADIPWGSERVMAVTRARLAELGLRWLELPLRWDVDRPADYARLAREMPSLAAGLMTDAPAPRP